MPTDDDLDALQAQLAPEARDVVTLLRQALADRDAQLAQLTEQLDEMKRMLFGKRSEKLPPIDREVRRAVQADELTVDGEPMPQDQEQRNKERRRKARKKSEPARKAKRKLRKNLPILHEQVKVDPDALPEGYRLQDFRSIGEGEVIRRVEHVREHLVVVQYSLQTLGSHDGEHILKAQAPESVVAGGHYGPSVYAHVVTAKCKDSLPLHRIAAMMERAGCPIARSTLCEIFHRSAELLLPIYQRLLDHVRVDPLVHADETRLLVQAKDQCLQGWIWAILCGRAVVYTFDESRGGEVAKQLLGGTQGDLVIDGYSGYNGVTGTQGRTRVGCRSHFRRKFFEAMNTVPEAKEILDMVVELYRIEHQAAERGILGTEAHAVLRDTESRAIVEKIDTWVDERKGKYPPKSKMGRAITYAIKQRTALNRFLGDPKLPLDNNLAERVLRIIALGRKNFLFAGHIEGAQNLAILQSIVATCDLHGLNPYEYVCDLLIRIQTHPASRIEELMPWNWQPDRPPKPHSSPSA